MSRPQSLVLVTIDCLRADHVRHMGYERRTTPFLDCVAAESTIFRKAYAAGSPTYYSLPAVLASRYPLALGRNIVGIAPGESTLATVLQESGFATAAFCAGNPYISQRFGYDQGFEVFRDFARDELPPANVAPEGYFRGRANRLLSRFCHAVPGLSSAYDELYFAYCQRKSDRGNESLDSLRRFPSADLLVHHAIEWLRDKCDRPFFLWLHLMDPHAPYFPKPEALSLMGDEFDARQARYLNSRWARTEKSQDQLARDREQVIKLYDAGIRWADEQIRVLSEALVDLNQWNKCALAVTADHGEEFLEHGGRFHAPLKLTEEMIHVPLLLRVPSIPRAEIDQPTSLLDLAPTLLEILGLPSPADFRGRNCWKKPVGSQASPVISETVYGCSNPLDTMKRMNHRILAIRTGNYKIVMDFSSGSDQLFDLSSDPKERTPLPLEAAPEIRRDLLQCGRRHLAESIQSRDFDRHNAALLRDLRIEWAHPSRNVPN